MSFLTRLFGGSDSSNRSSANATTTSSSTNQADNRVVLGNDAVQVGQRGTYAANSNNRNETSFQVNDSSSHDLRTFSNFEDHRDYSYRDSSQRNLTNNISDSSVRSTSSAFTDARNLSDSSQRNLTNNISDSSVRSTSSAFTDARNLSDASVRSNANSGNTTTIGTDGGAVQIAGFNAQLLRSVSENQGDTVRLLSAMGADGISKQAAAATDLFATSSTAASSAWGHTIDKSAELIDKLLLTAKGTIAGANSVASQAVSSFTPTANKQADAFKWAAIAAGVLIAMKALKA